MLGYPSNHKGYRLWCPRLAKVIVCRDEVFFENVLPLKLKSIAYLPSFGVDSPNPKPTYKAILEKSNQELPSDSGLLPPTAPEQAKQDLDNDKNLVASDEHPDTSDIIAVPMDLDSDINDENLPKSNRGTKRAYSLLLQAQRDLSVPVRNQSGMMVLPFMLILPVPKQSWLLHHLMHLQSAVRTGTIGK